MPYVDYDALNQSQAFQLGGHRGDVHIHEAYSPEVDLCELLQTMRLDEHAKSANGSQPAPGYPTSPNPQDEAMGMSIESTQVVAPQSSSQVAQDQTPASVSADIEQPCGCAFLRTIRAQLEGYGTTNGEYLEAIFTHREIFYSYPDAHRDCARAFGEIAFMLERRAWRADREADTEAVSAFRHESWAIWSAFASSSNASSSSRVVHAAPGLACVMPMM